MSNNTKELISQIKLSISILDIVEEHVNLKKVGRNFKGICPFHQEHTPSFSVNPEKEMWRCFGCGKSGDLINFFAEINGYTNKQAIRILSNKLGLNNTGRYKKKIDELAKQRAANIENQIKFTNALQKLINQLKNIIKILKWITRNFTTLEDLEEFGELEHEIVYLQYLLERTGEMSNQNDENEMYIILKEIFLMYKPLLIYFKERRETDANRSHI